MTVIHVNRSQPQIRGPMPPRVATLTARSPVRDGAFNMVDRGRTDSSSVRLRSEFRELRGRNLTSTS
jgi:hypothetical protein